MEEIERIYREYQPLVYRHLCAACGDSLLAEEVAQETFFRIISRCCTATSVIWGRFFRKREPAAHQICRLADQLLLREISRRERQRLSEISFFIALDVPRLEYLPEASAVYIDELNGVYEKIRNLQQPVQGAMCLKYYGNKTYKEIGEHFGQSENWARNVVHRGKEQLERMLRHEVCL